METKEDDLLGVNVVARLHKSFFFSFRAAEDRTICQSSSSCNVGIMPLDGSVIARLQQAMRIHRMFWKGNEIFFHI